MIAPFLLYGFFMLFLSQAINAFIRGSASAVRWLGGIMVLITCLIVALRYGSDISFIGMISQKWIDLTALQEVVMYCHAALFMLGAAYALQQNAHVRVDIFYRNWSAKRQQLVNRVGILIFAIPFCVFCFLSSWDLVADSWHVLETSQEPGGLPFVYLFKTLLLVMPVLVFLQCIALLISGFMPTDNTKECDNA